MGTDGVFQGLIPSGIRGTTIDQKNPYVLTEYLTGDSQQKNNAERPPNICVCRKRR